jgi:hypothetical protein
MRQRKMRMERRLMKWEEKFDKIEASEINDYNKSKYN